MSFRSQFSFPNGRTVARLGYGAMRLTGHDRDHDVSLLRRAVELGVQHIDTARMYGGGRNEELVAEALAPFDGDELLIATKGGIELHGDGYLNDGRPEALRRHVEESLRRLRVDRLGLYYLHEPDPEVPIAESVGSLADLRKEGKIDLLGLSNVNATQFLDALRITPIAAVQNRSRLTPASDDSILALTVANGIAFVPWGPLRGATNDSTLAVGSLTPAQLALSGLLRSGPNVLPIPGTTSMDHLEENMATTLGAED